MATTEARMKQLTGAYADLNKSNMLVGEMAVPSDHVPVVRNGVNSWEDLLTSQSAGDIIALSETMTEQIESFEQLVIDKVGINDSTATLTQAYSGSKTQELIDGVNTNLTTANNNITLKANQTALDATNTTLALKADKSEVTNVMTPKGNSLYASLPATGNTVGWYYYCPDGDGTHGAGNYVWNGTSWYFGGTGDEGYSKIKSDLTQSIIKTENARFTVKNIDKYVKIDYENLTLLPYTDYAGFDCYYLEVAKGDTYRISGTSFAPSGSESFPNHRAWGLYNMSKVLVAATLLIQTGVTEATKDYIYECETDGYLIVQGLRSVQTAKVEKLISKVDIETLSNHNAFTITRNGYYKKTDGSVVALTGYSFIQCVFNPNEDNYFKISGFDWHSVYYGYMFMSASGNIISTCAALNNKFETVVKAPEGASILIVNGTSDGGVDYLPTLTRSFYPFEELENHFIGKKVVWFGTSIPEGRVNGISYPDIVASKLGLTVYNEAKGSSRVRDDNTQYFPLSLTVAEIKAKSWYSGLSEEWKTLVEACSYENKLDRYLTAFGGSIGDVDLYIFDHGYNDRDANNHSSITNVPENLGDRTTYIGAMNFLISRILSNNPNSKIAIVSHYENTGDDEVDFAAGYYVCQAQEYVANRWGLPYLRLYERLNMSPTIEIYTPYGWVNGVWTYTGTYQIINNKNRRCADKVHPHTDLSGKTTQMMGDNLAEMIKQLVF